jgi:hypothetical protein
MVLATKPTDVTVTWAESAGRKKTCAPDGDAGSSKIVWAAVVIWWSSNPTKPTDVGRKRGAQKNLCPRWERG